MENNIDHILNDESFQKTLAQLALDKGDSLINIHEEAREYLEELFTQHQPMMDVVAVQTMQYILGRGYEKTIDVNVAEMRELTKIAYHHPIAFVMTHKTYIDMFVLAVVLARHGLPLPYIFAGINMDFLGLGQIARQSGAIFIRRSFKENLVYKATLRHYITTLVNQKAHFMWAIEGTRSRTGKLVWPKMGILKYIREAELQSSRKVKYIPVSIVYDLIPDVKEMTLETLGKRKAPESLQWFLNYVRKMGNDFGKISMRFGAPVEVSENTSSLLGLNTKYDTSEAGTIPRFALELVHRINQITPVTTTSLVAITLLSKFALPKRGIEADIVDLMRLIESYQSDALVDRGKPIGESVQKALNLLIQGGLVHRHGESLNARISSNQ